MVTFLYTLPDPWAEGLSWSSHTREGTPDSPPKPARSKEAALPAGFPAGCHTARSSPWIAPRQSRERQSQEHPNNSNQVPDACLQPKSQALQSDTAPSITHLDLHQRTGGNAPNCTQSPSRERQTPSQESRQRGKHGDKCTKTSLRGRPRAGAGEVRMGACAPVLPFPSPGHPQDL